MPKYQFRIARGKYSGACNDSFRSEDDAGAWLEMTKVCGDLVGNVCRDLNEGFDWQMELLDENEKLLFRIWLVAETLM